MSKDNKCDGKSCSSCEHKQGDEDCKLKLAMNKIKNKIVVMSGKGGVGKSTVAVNLAEALAQKGNKVGLLDVDLHGPSVPKMLHIEDAKPMGGENFLVPVEVGNLKVMSVGFLLDSPDNPVIWRGPMKIGVIKQFLSDVEWGELDYLVIDSPPGTGDEPLSVCQFIADSAEAVIVTTPQQVSAVDVSKSLNFCNQLGICVLGLVENMSGFICPKCGEITEIFSAGSGEELSEQYKVNLLGKIPIDPMICRAGDNGKPFIHYNSDSIPGKVFSKIVEQIMEKKEI